MIGGNELIQLNYRDSKPIYEQIKDGLRRLVVTGSFKSNEQLPSVRELASSLTINPNTIQRAYRDLESEGYLYSVVGKGTFVAEWEEVIEVRQESLLAEFDEVVSELFYLSVEKTELVARMDKLAKGGDGSDTGK